jgi:hypothetical protein
MDVKDEDLIDITQRLELTKAHICTDPSTLSATQRYWLAEFPELNAPIPEDAHPDLPEFDPPFNAEQMQQYQDKCNSKVPRSSPKMQDKIDDCFSKLSDARIVDISINNASDFPHGFQSRHDLFRPNVSRMPNLIGISAVFL